MFSCADPKNFEFKGLQDIKIEKISMGKNNIRAKIKYYNPNNFSMVLKQIDCDILMNNQFVYQLIYFFDLFLQQVE